MNGWPRPICPGPPARVGRTRERGTPSSMRPAVITPSGGARAHDRSGHAGLGGIREPRIRPWRNWENRRGPQRTEKDRESCRRPCRGARESSAKCRHCRGCGNSPEPITIRSRTCRRRSWWTTPCNSIQQLRRSVRRPTRVRSTPGTAEGTGLRRRHGASDLDPRRTRNRRGGAGRAGRGDVFREQSRDRHAHAPLHHCTTAPLGDRTTAGPKRDR